VRSWVRIEAGETGRREAGTPLALGAPYEADTVKVDVFGRYELEVRWTGSQWVAERLDLGKRRRVDGLVIPSHLPESEIVSYLADLLHELARPGYRVRRLP
jgi:hypothetical protein